MIIRYDSIAALRNDYIKMNCNPHAAGTDYNWYNRETPEDTLRKTELGDTSLVARAEEAITKLETILETPRPTWQRNVAGAFCCVPDVLAGLPTPMRRLHHNIDEHNPITIIANTASSSAFSAEMLAQRGIYILALVIALSRVRPVTLHQMSTGNGNDSDGETVVISEINTHPLDLATACYVLTSSGFTRRICYAVKQRKGNGYIHRWPNSYNPSNPDPYNQGLTRRLGLDPKNSLIIPGAHLHDELVTKPIIWLNKQIERFTTNQEAT